MAKRNLFEELEQGLKEMKAEREGKITLKTTEVNIPAPIKMSKTRIQRIRKASNYSQAVFARVLGASVKTHQKWEQGQSEPNEQAKLLLEMVDRDEKFLETLASMTVGKPSTVGSKKGVIAKTPSKVRTATKKRVAPKRARAKGKSKSASQSEAAA